MINSDKPKKRYAFILTLDIILDKSPAWEGAIFQYYAVSY